MADITLRATNLNGPNDVRLYVVASGKTPVIPGFVTIYLIPLNKAPASLDKMSVVFI
jgi:hypothetical protein